ncbi:MAG: hypothetical protein HYS15_01965 [Candidatus Spechtbacteria bacterium]|nr:hypothetical protein [Candidatus Spechtbacteria bacterium]
MTRIFAPISREKYGVVEVETMLARILCDNISCRFYSVGRVGTYWGIPEAYLEGVVARDGKDFCSEECYLMTPDAKARMELTIPDEDIPHRTV